MVTQTTTKILYSGDGLSLEFNFPFKVFVDQHVKVSLIDTATRVITSLAAGVDFTVTRLSEGGSITFFDAPPFGTRILIKRVQPLVQDLDLSSAEALRLQQLENRLDILTMMIQEQATEIERTSKKPEDSVLNIEFPLEAVPWSVLQWDGTGGKLINFEVNFAEQLDDLEELLRIYIDIQDAATLTAANDYTDIRAASALAQANDYTDSQVIAAGAVTSVAGRAGNVILFKADITDFDESDYATPTDVTTEISTAIDDALDALTAAYIPNVPSGNLAATNSQDAVNELQGDIDLLNTAVSALTAFGNPPLIWGTLGNDTYGIPILIQEQAREVFQFPASSKTVVCLTGLFKVPDNYVSGGLNLKFSFYSKLGSANAQFQAIVSVYRSTYNTALATETFNGSVQALTANNLYDYVLTLTNGSGQISGQAIQAGDLINILLFNSGPSNNTTGDIYLVNNTSGVINV